MRFKLTAKENQNTGEMGWLDSRIPRSSDAFEPLAYPYGLAHDCLEHTAFGSVADEIEAHGAMYWVRYEGGWSMPRYGQTLNMESFASEWINLYNGLQAESYLPTPRKTRALDSAIEEDISSIIEQGRGTVRAEYGEGDNGPDGFENDLDRIADVFRAYFRIGYRNAARRYKGLASCEVANLYNVLADAFERQRIEYEGQEIEVTVNLATGRVRIEELISEEY
jgi:hypothetical protein